MKARRLFSLWLLLSAVHWLATKGLLGLLWQEGHRDPTGISVRLINGLLWVLLLPAHMLAFAIRQLPYLIVDWVSYPLFISSTFISSTVESALFVLLVRVWSQRSQQARRSTS